MIEGDAMSLAFGTMNLTLSRSLSDFAIFRISPTGLAELHRILKPGGRLAVLEFSSPIVPGFGRLFNFYFSHDPAANRRRRQRFARGL